MINLKGRKIIAKPAFVKLNPKSIDFYHNFNPESLYGVIPLNSIQRITQIYKGTYCFDLNIQKNGSETKVTTICLFHKEQLNDWVNSILEFKKCLIHTRIQNTINNVSLNNNNKKDKLNELKYGNTNILKIDSKKVDTNLRRLYTTIIKGNLYKKRYKRIMKGKLNVNNIIYEDQHRKEEIIKKMMNKRFEKRK